MGVILIGRIQALEAALGGRTAVLNAYQSGVPLLTSKPRSLATVTTGSLANNAGAGVSYSLGKTSVALEVQTDRAARVRLYSSQAARDADVARAAGTDPASDSGCLLEVITAGAEDIELSPVAVLYSSESSDVGSLGQPSATIYGQVTNLSGSASPVTVYLVYYPLEA